MEDSQIIFYESNRKFKNFTLFKKIEPFQKKMKFFIDYRIDKSYWYLLLNPFIRAVREKVYRNKIRKLIDPWQSQDKYFYIFNDRSPICQYILWKYTKDKKNTFALVQDGLAQYTEFTLRSKKPTFFKKLYYKLIYGFFWKPSFHLGDKYDYKILYSLLPEVMSHRYMKIAQKIQIKSENFFSQEFKLLSQKVIQSELPEFLNLSRQSLLIFLPNIIEPSLVSKIEEEIKKLISQSKSYTHIYIKRHPRSYYEISMNKNTYKNTCKVVDIPSRIAAEHFFAFESEKNIDFIVAPSTLILIALISEHKSSVRMAFLEHSDELLIQENKGLMKMLTPLRTSSMNS